MKKTNAILLCLIILINTITSAGCWNYREIDKISIVAGLAIDKGNEKQYQLTVEIVQITSGKDTKMVSKTITTEGDTMFDAARNIISLSGKRLYWSHAKIIILSKEIATDGITKVMDWYNRDAETREDIHLLVSQEKSAKEIFDGQGVTEDIKSFTLDEMLTNQVSLNKAPDIDILKFDNQSKAMGVSQILPSINLKKVGDKMVPHIEGSAIIKYDQLVGFLNGEETKDLIFIRSEVRGGVLVEKIENEGKPNYVSLEIFKSKTKIAPTIDGENITIQLDIDTTVALDEATGTKDLFNEQGLLELEQTAEETLTIRIDTLIKKVQTEYDADIFGFASKLQEDKAKVWKNVGDNWDEVFKNLAVETKSKMHIKNSGVLSKAIKEGD